MEVANTVASIISALGNGKDLFRRMLGQKPKRHRYHGRNPTMSEEEAWLRDSLSRTPETIRSSFNNKVLRHGKRFEVGDEVAHSSLARILFVLNTGLMALIDKILNGGGGGKHDMAESNRVLRHLSEEAMRETLGAMSELSLRLDGTGQAVSRAGGNGKEDRRRRSKDVKKAQSDGNQTNKLDARKKSIASSTTTVKGAWVRPIKDASRSASLSSTVSAASASSKALSKRNSDPKSRNESARGNKHDSATNLSLGRHPHPQGVHEPRARPTPSTPRETSMFVVPSDLFLPHLVEPDASINLPFHVRKRPNASLDRHRPRPISTATFMTGSTKLGEIPPARLIAPLTTDSHRVIEQVDDPRLMQYLFEQDRIAVGGPAGGFAAAAAGGGDGKPRKLRRGFKFWKRPE